MLSEIEVLYFLLQVGFFPSSIYICVPVQHLGRVIENTAGDGCCERDSIVPEITQTAYSCGEKNELQDTIVRNICTVHGIPCLQCVWKRVGSALPSRTQEQPRSHPPGRGSLAPRPLQTPQITPVISCHVHKRASCPLLPALGSLVGLKWRKIRIKRCGC